VIKSNSRYYFFVFYHLFVLLLISGTKGVLYAQPNDSAKCRKISLWAGYATVYVGSMTVLYQTWYKNYTQTSFHWFNDNDEWLQMDKAGHAFTSFQLSHASSSIMSWAGYSKKQSILWGTFSSWFVMNSIEIFDGFSSNWGASYGDILANTAGAAMFFGQAYFFNHKPFSLKYSFHFTDYPEVRPDELGKTKIEQILKDYNGQTYWLSVNINDLISSFRPRWLNLAIGYSVKGMISGHAEDTPISILSQNYIRQRQFYFSLDVSPSNINIRMHWIKALLKTFDVIKVPFPTMGYSNQRFKFYPVYF